MICCGDIRFSETLAVVDWKERNMEFTVLVTATFMKVLLIGILLVN